MAALRVIIAAVALLWATNSHAASIMYTYQNPTAVNADLDTFKAMNIDVVMNYWADQIYDQMEGTGSLSAYMAWVGAELERYRAKNLKGLIRLGWAATQIGASHGGPDLVELRQIITAFKDHPALYGWYAYDEPQIYATSPSYNATYGYTVPMVEDVYTAIKEIDSVHPVFVVYPGYGSSFFPSGEGTSYPISTTRRMWDTFGVDNYAISNYQSQIAASKAAVPSQYRDSLFNVLGVGGTFTRTAADLSTMAAATVATGWNSSGDISFWLWDWPINGLGMKNNTSIHATVTSIAAQYHEDLYGSGGATPTTTYRATMRASFR